MLHSSLRFSLPLVPRHSVHPGITLRTGFPPTPVPPASRWPAVVSPIASGNPAPAVLLQN